MSAKSKRLLVIDDEPDFAEFVKRAAESVGYEVEAISDPNKFKDICREFDPTVVVLDMVMPDIEGIELVQWLAEVQSQAKIIVVTGYNPYYSKMASVLGEVRGLTISTSRNPSISQTCARRFFRHFPGLWYKLTTQTPALGL